MKTLLTATACLIALASGAQAACGPSPITRHEILDAQEAWGDGIVAIGKSKDPEIAARNHIDALYAYDIGPVLFKPTKASVLQFRDTKARALSYFIGGGEPEDKGFALTPFTKVRFENHAMTLDCDSALAQGNYYFTTKDGQEIKVEYSFGYVKDEHGDLRINLQHSSFPYKDD